MAPQCSIQQPIANGKRKSPDETSLFCNTYIVAQRKRTVVGSGIAKRGFTGQFQCTFHGCNKRLKNNVVFMYHIWAHIAQQKATESEEEQTTNLQILQAEQNGTGGDDSATDGQRDDVSRLLTCSECLLEQPTPHRARLHYHRVHKRADRPLLDVTHGLFVCNICEQVIDDRSMKAHMDGHRLPANSLLYVCRFSGGGRKCQFRTSNRHALLQHFCTKHVGTHVVMCPFCLLTFCVPPTCKRDSLVRMREFVRHMTLHDGEKSRHCAHCVIRIPFSQRAQMVQHQEQHAKRSADHKWLQWQMQQLDLNDLRPERSRALTTSDMGIQQCTECGQMVQQLSKHLDRSKQRCNFCAYTTHCKHAMTRHRLLSLCNPANAVRTPFGGWKPYANNGIHKMTTTASSWSSLPQFSCMGSHDCTYRTANVQALAEHIASVHHQQPNKNNNNEVPPSCSGARVLLLSPKRDGMELLDMRDFAISEAERHEVELFGLRRMADISLKAKDDTTTTDDDDDSSGDGTEQLPWHHQPSTARDDVRPVHLCATQRAAMGDWLAGFLPLAHANAIAQRCWSPDRLRLFRELRAQEDNDDNAGGDDDDDVNDDDHNGKWKRALQRLDNQRQAEEHERYIKIGLLLDDFPPIDFTQFEE